MTWRDRAAFLVSGLGAASSVAWAYVAVRGVVALLHQGGGSFGSGTAFGAFVYVLPFLATVWLAGKLRGRGGSATILRQLYLLTTLILLATFALFASQLLFGEIFGDGLTGWILLVSSFLAGALWLPVQTFFAAAFVGLLIRRRQAVREG